MIMRPVFSRKENTLDRRVRFRHIETIVEICRRKEIPGADPVTWGRGDNRLIAACAVFLQFADSSPGALRQVSQVSRI